MVKPMKDSKFSNSDIDMSLVLDKSTQIVQVHDDDSIESDSKTFTFTQISELQSLKNGTFVDVIGVVVNVGEGGLVPGSNE